MVVFVLPLAELLGELGRSPEDHASVELVFVCPMAPLDLSIGLGAAPRNLPVGHPEIPQVPGKVGPKLGAMIRLDALDRHRQAAAHFLDDVRGRFEGVVSIDPKHAIPGGLPSGACSLADTRTSRGQISDRRPTAATRAENGRDTSSGPKKPIRSPEGVGLYAPPNSSTRASGGRRGGSEATGLRLI